MKILIVCGFLGSGKTTLIRALAEELRQQSDRPIAIIENEAGREGLDARLLAQPQIYVTEIYGGCLCCKYSSNLLPAAGTAFGWPLARCFLSRLGRRMLLS